MTLGADGAFDVGEPLDLVTAPTLVIGGGKEIYSRRELMEETAAGVQDGRAHIYPDWRHVRTGMSSTTTSLTLGLLLAAQPS